MEQFIPHRVTVGLLIFMAENAEDDVNRKYFIGRTYCSAKQAIFVIRWFCLFCGGMCGKVGVL